MKFIDLQLLFYNVLVRVYSQIKYAENSFHLLMELELIN